MRSPEVETTAKPNQIEEGQLVNLIGVANDDEEVVSYSWQAPKEINIQNPNNPVASFTAPDVNKDTDFTISLTVTDNDGLIATDTVVVRVENVVVLIPPEALISVYPNPANEGQRVTLDGSKSSDPDGRIVSYLWENKDGISIENADKAIATFNASEVTGDTDFIFTLTVTDNDGKIDTASVIVAVKNVLIPPLTKISVNPNPAREGELVILDGSQSFDPNGKIVRYQWRGPKGIVIINPTNPRVSFIAPRVNKDTRFTFSLTVTDNDGQSNTGSVSLMVRNVLIHPEARASAPYFANEGDLVTLNGSASYDPDGTIVSYQWTAPQGIQLSNPSAMDPTFTAPQVIVDTIYEFTLVVTDNDGLTNTATVSVTVRDMNQPEIIIE